jgi:hypothetical protein
MEGRFCVTDTPRRELPPLPHIDRLKKEAKARLGEMRIGAPSARLADAQFLLAREYGFASWAALKAEVERLAGSAVATELRQGRARGALHRAETQGSIGQEAEPHPPGHFLRLALTAIVIFAIVALLGLALIFGGTDQGPARLMSLMRAFTGRAP